MLLFFYNTFFSRVGNRENWCSHGFRFVGEEIAADFISPQDTTVPSVSFQSNKKRRTFMLSNGHILQFQIPSGDLKSPKNKEAQDFEALRQECLQSGKLFEDPEFDAVKSSLYFNKERATQYANVSWLRAPVLGKLMTNNNPTFIVDGASRLDIAGGKEGEYWFTAVLAMVAANETLLSQIVPADQSFNEKYCGIFHFRFTQMGRWVDVVVDDRLPVRLSPDDTIRLYYTKYSKYDEFWSALLEKAYAKLYGSYEALYNGAEYEAMEDLTGGLAIQFIFDELLPVPNFFEAMELALAKQSFIAANIVAGEKEKNKLSEKGLVNYHAYTVTGVRYVNMTTPKKTEKVPLVRIRNPWVDEKEWRGPWSDDAQEWKYVSEETKKELGLKTGADGEFWMTYHDFIHTYSSVTFCLIYPNVLPTNPVGERWEVSVLEGKWTRGGKAGGSNVDTLHENPQYRIKLEANDDGLCIMYIAVMQHSQRALRNFLRRNSDDYLRVGFVVYKLEDHDSVPHPLSAEYIRSHKWYETSRIYSNLREVSARFRVPPGVYVTIPTTHDPDVEGEFILRIVTEKKHHTL